MSPVLNLTIEKPRDASANSACRIIATSGASSATASVPLLLPAFHAKLKLLQAELLRGAPSRRVNPDVDVDVAQNQPGIMSRLRDATGVVRRPPVVLLRRAAAPSVDTAREASSVPAANEPMEDKPAGTNLASAAAERMLEEIGSELFQFLFSEIQDLLKASRAESKALGKPLLIRLCVKHPELAAVPWEALYDPQSRSYVTTSNFTPFTRSVDLNENLVHSPIKPPLRILAMASRVRSMANGTQMGAIGVDQELRGIREALDKLLKKKTVRLGQVPSAQPRHLDLVLSRGDDDIDDDGDAEAARAESWNIFHFIGHGGYDEDRKMGYVIVQEKGGAMGAKLFSSMLQQFLVQPGRTPSLVVLNSCSGATELSGKLFSSIAAELVQAGIPAVVAMQFEISDDMAISFAKLFYTYLSEGDSIQAALTHTRKVLQSEGYSEWIAPVLYMQSTDGLVFRTTAAPAAARG